MTPQEQEFQLYRTFQEVYSIDQELYKRFDVKRGLRNADGTGVIAGLTKISNVHGYVMNEGEKQASEGSLTYRGYEITDLVEDSIARDYFGFGRVVYLLLTGRFPETEQYNKFNAIIEANRDLPTGFIRNIIANKPPRDIMNQLIRTVLALYPYDENIEDVGSPQAAPHEIHAALSLIGKLPRVSILGHYAADAFYNNGSIIIHPIISGQSTAEFILSMLRPDRQFTHDEAKMLDIMLMIHAEHGGGNNSTFTCRCLTSSGTDPYSAYAGAIASLKGPKHGGANLRALDQQDDLRASVKNWRDEGQVADYLKKTLYHETFDGSGLIYGMGHAVYTLSDPRAVLCKKYAKQLAEGTEFEDRFRLIETIEQLTPELYAKQKGITKPLCANVDMYSGLIYTMLGIPRDLFTPMFACARMAGWAAHRFEEIYASNRIMRPAYKAVYQKRSLNDGTAGLPPREIRLHASAKQMAPAEQGKNASEETVSQLTSARIDIPEDGPRIIWTTGNQPQAQAAEPANTADVAGAVPSHEEKSAAWDLAEKNGVTDATLGAPNASNDPVAAQASEEEEQRERDLATNLKLRELLTNEMPYFDGN